MRSGMNSGQCRDRQRGAWHARLHATVQEHWVRHARLHATDTDGAGCTTTHGAVQSHASRVSMRPPVARRATPCLTTSECTGRGHRYARNPHKKMQPQCREHEQQGEHEGSSKSTSSNGATEPPWLHIMWCCMHACAVIPCPSKVGCDAVLSERVGCHCVNCAQDHEKEELVCSECARAKSR